MGVKTTLGNAIGKNPSRKFRCNICEGGSSSARAGNFGPPVGVIGGRRQKVLQAASSRKKAAQPSGLKVANLLGGSGPWSK